MSRSHWWICITALRISGDPLKIYFHKDCPLQPLDGRRAAAASKWMEIRRADGAGAKRLLHRLAQRQFEVARFCVCKKSDALNCPLELFVSFI